MYSYHHHHHHLVTVRAVLKTYHRPNIILSWVTGRGYKRATGISHNDSVIISGNKYKWSGHHFEHCLGTKLHDLQQVKQPINGIFWIKVSSKYLEILDFSQWAS